MCATTPGFTTSASTSRVEVPAPSAVARLSATVVQPGLPWLLTTTVRPARMDPPLDTLGGPSTSTGLGANAVGLGDRLGAEQCPQRLAYLVRVSVHRETGLTWS